MHKKRLQGEGWSKNWNIDVTVVTVHSFFLLFTFAFLVFLRGYADSLKESIDLLKEVRCFPCGVLC